MTGDPIQDLFVRMGMDIAPYQEGVQKVGDASNVCEQSIQQLLAGVKSLDETIASLKAATDPAAEALQQAGESARRTAQATQEADQAARQASGGFGEMTDSLIKMAATVASLAALKQLAEDSLQAYGEIQKTEIALNAMGGSADVAATSLEGLRSIAQQDALSFPQLVVANQRLISFGLTAEQANQALQVAADVAAATNGSFASVAEKMGFMSEAGILNNRAMKELRLTFDDVATAMNRTGLSAQEVKTAWQNMGDDTAARMEILERAVIKKFGGIGELMANTVPGQMQIAKNEITFALQQIGAAIAPVAELFVGLAKVIATVADFMIAGGKTFQNVMTGIVTVAVEAYSGIASAMSDAAQGKFGQAGEDLKNALSRMQLTTAGTFLQMLSDGKQSSDRLDQIWATVPKAAAIHFGALPPIITQTQKDMDKAWAAFVAQEYKMALPFGKTPNASSDTQEIAQQYEAAIAAHKKGQQETSKFEAGFPEFMSGGWDIMGEKLDATMQKAEKAAPAMSILFDPVTKSLQMVTARTRDVNDTTGQFIDKMLFLAETSGGTMAAVLKLNDAYKTLGTQSMPEVLKSADDVAKAFGTVTGTVSDTQGVLLADTSQMTNDQQRLWLDTVTKIQGYWKTLGQAIPEETQLAMDQVKTHLEDASMTIDQAFKNLGVTSQISLQQTAKQAQDSYELIKESGQATTRELLQAWTNMTEKQVAATGDLGRLWVDMTKQMSHGLADAIVDGKNFGDAMITVFKNIAKTILSELIEGALTKLGASLFGISNQASGLGGIFSKIGGGLGGIVGAAGEEMPAALDAAGNVVGDVTQAGAGAAGATGAVGSLLSSLGSIGSIAGAIAGIGSGIVSGIQQAHANNLLDEIEKSTRYTKIMTELSIVPNVEKFLPRINEIRDFFFDWAQPIWFDMHEYLRDTRDHLMGGGSILAGTSAVGVFNAPGDTGIRLSPDSIAALAAAIAAASGSSGDGGGVAGAVPSPAVIDKLNNAVFRRFKQQGLAPTKA